jgi:hypothetical protein
MGNNFLEVSILIFCTITLLYQRCNAKRDRYLIPPESLEDLEGLKRIERRFKYE